MLKPIRYLSVCSGIEAVTAAWHDLVLPDGQPAFIPVGFSEIEPFPSAVLQHHYPSVPNLGDMTQHHDWTARTGPIDLLIGGTPCQSFSIAGLREGLADPRGNLTLTYLALAEQYRPRWIIWENVPGVLSDKTNAFGCFTGGLSKLGYGWAYRILDAQYYGLAQRRRRVFVVGCLGDWTAAAAVLFELASLRGDPAPRRETGERATGTLAARTRGGGGLGTDFDLDGGLIANTMLGKSCSPHAADLATYIPEVTHSLRCEGFDASEDGTGRGTPLIPEIIPPLTTRPFADNDGQEGKLIIEDKTPLLFGGGNTSGPIEVAACLNTNHGCYSPGDFEAGQPADCPPQSLPVEAAPIAYDTTQVTSKANFSNPKPGDPCHPLAAQAHPPIIAFSSKDCGLDATEEPNGGGQMAVAYAIQERAVAENPDCGPAGVGIRDDDTAYTLEARQTPQAVAFNLRGREGGAMPEVDPDNLACQRAASGGSSRSYVAASPAANLPMQVRRLTPRECERLMGLPDDYTRIPWRGKPAELCPDGPRYKANGNSMARPVIRWLGKRLLIILSLLQKS